VLGAVRAGIQAVILPKENAPDLDDLPEEVRKTLEVHLVEELGDVLSLALRGARYEAGHLIFEEPVAALGPRMVSST
ncbi:MAG: S16 family serine protease, partial [Gemmatimonadales bacterium]